MGAVAADSFDAPRAGMGADGRGDGRVGGGDDTVPVASFVDKIQFRPEVFVLKADLLIREL